MQQLLRGSPSIAIAPYILGSKPGCRFDFLFIIYIEDIKISCGTMVKLRLNVDGCVLYCNDTNVHDQRCLNDVVFLFCAWSRHWKMEINCNKTVAMIFGNKKQPFHFTYGYAGQQLTNVD